MFLAATAASTHAAITGNLSTTSVNYGSPIVLQSINTGFGDSSGNDGTNGSELDSAYGSISGGNLNLLICGDFQNTGNHLNLFVDGGAPGQSVLSAPAGTSMQNMNGSVFSPGFQATYAYDTNDYSGTLYNEEYVYNGPGSLAGGYVGSLAESTTGIAPAGVPTGGSNPAFATIALNNNNVSTMGAAGTAANQTTMAAATTGFEISIPLSQIGYTGGSILVLADINGNPDNYLANQFLPGLPVGTQNVGGGGPYSGVSDGAFNFGATPGEYFTVSVPEPASITVLGGAITMLCARRRA
jgi:hypothetical protein